MHLPQHGPAAVAPHARPRRSGRRAADAQAASRSSGRTRRSRDHPGFDKIVVLAVSPQYLDGELIGTVDVVRRHRRRGRRHPERCNEYIAGCVRAEPDTLHRLRVGQPRVPGVRTAVEELERAVTVDGLTG